MKRVIGLVTLLSTVTFALQIYPIPVKLEQGERYKDLSIMGDNGKYQVFIKKWEQKDGNNILKTTKDIVAYPNILQAPKRIKIYRKNIITPKVEKAYRVILKELKINSLKNKTNILKVLSIPIFILPAKWYPKLEIKCKGNLLEIKNRGNIHYKILKINDRNIMQYIFPNQDKEVQHIGVKGMVRTNRGDFKYQCKK